MSARGFNHYAVDYRTVIRTTDRIEQGHAEWKTLELPPQGDIMGLEARGIVPLSDGGFLVMAHEYKDTHDAEGRLKESTLLLKSP